MVDFQGLPDFQALVVAAAGKPERSMGESVIPAEPPQWREVRSIAQKLMKIAPEQLALHVYLIQAEASLNGFAGFRDALQGAIDLVENQWDSLEPAPDQSDPEDMYYERINLVNELSHQAQFLDTLNRLTLVSARGIGDFCTRDIDISSGIVSGTDDEKARCQVGLIRGAFAESDAQDLQQLSSALDCLPDMLGQLQSLFDQNTGQVGGVTLQPLRDRVENCGLRFHEFADEFLQQPAEIDAGGDQSMAAGTADGLGQAQNPAHVSSLTDRTMVLASFDSILLYYQQHEPSSPVRILTLRAREFVDKSFFDVVKTLATGEEQNLPAMLAELQKKPVASLMIDSYTRFLTGETLPDLPVVQVTESRQTAAPADVSADNDPAQASETSQSSTDIEAGSTRNSGNSHNVAVISSREQVLAVLQDIESFFAVKEPASPIPLLIVDIRALVGKHFVDLVADFVRLMPDVSKSAEE